MLRFGQPLQELPVPVGRVGCYRFWLSSLPLREASEHVLCSDGLLAHARRRLYPPRSRNCDCPPDSCRSTPVGLESALGGVGGIGIRGRHLVLLMHRLFGGVLLLQFHQVLARSLPRFTCAASLSCSRGMRLSLAAFASMKLPSTDNASLAPAPLPHTAARSAQTTAQTASTLVIVRAGSWRTWSDVESPDRSPDR